MKKNYFVHPSSCMEDKVEIGNGTRIWYFCHIRCEARIGRNCNIGQNVFIDRNVTIGDNVKIQNNVSVYTGVEIGSGAFLGPSCVFTNVKKPRSLYPKTIEEYSKTTVGQGATIGANSTIICPVTIGKQAFIGAGAVVTKNVPDYALVVGNPAKQIGWTCECGEKLRFKKNKKETQCKICGKIYRENKGCIEKIK